MEQYANMHDTLHKEAAMKYGARNTLSAKVKSVKKGDIMSLVKFDVTIPAEMASVLTTESLEALKMKKGDQVQLIIKAIHVLPVKE
jgi:molybdate transport system regulatory protein